MTDPKTPSGLPAPQTSTTPVEDGALQTILEKNKSCPQCGKPGRIASNYLGVNGHCAACKINWPITNSPLQPESPVNLPRGLSKQTAVEPDWNIAFEKD
jgi:hypothetical protein